MFEGIKMENQLISKEVLTMLFYAIMPISVIVKAINNRNKVIKENIKKAVKELHYLKSLKQKSDSHINRIEKLEKALKQK